MKDSEDIHIFAILLIYTIRISSIAIYKFNTYFQSTIKANTVKMFIQANELASERADLIIQYTDSYNQKLILNYEQLWNGFCDNQFQ